MLTLANTGNMFTVQTAIPSNSFKLAIAKLLIVIWFNKTTLVLAINDARRLFVARFGYETSHSFLGHCDKFRYQHYCI